MNETKHTLGPWHYKFNGFVITVGDKSTRHDYLEHDYTVAKTGGNSFQDEANARLIAAAPDLLEAAEKALAFFSRTRAGREWTGQGGQEREVLQKALAKANGE